MLDYTCNKCSKKFTHRGTYKRHLNKKIPCNKLQIIEDSKLNGTMLYNCFECKYITSDKDEFKQHVDNHYISKKDISIKVPKYRCELCSKLFSTKSNMVRHAKTSCQYKDQQSNSSSHSSDTYDIISYDSNKTDLTNKTEGDESNDVSDGINDLCKDQENTCRYCFKTFKKSYNLKRHLGGRCKSKKEEENSSISQIDELLKQGYSLEDIVQECNKRLQKKTVNNVNSHNTTNNINNSHSNNNTVNNINTSINVREIKLVAFGKEDLSTLSDDVIKKIIGRGFMSVPALVEHVHFNKDNPKFHNVYIPNIKEPYAVTYDGDIWGLRDKKEVIDELYQDKKDHLELKSKELSTELKPEAKKKFKRFIDTVEDNGTVEDKTKKDIKMLLYNSRKTTKKTRKQIEKLSEDIDEKKLLT